MRKLLLLLFLFTLTSNALAEDEKWALVILHFAPSVTSEDFSHVNRDIFVFDSKELCENNIIEQQESYGGIITRDTNNHMVLEQINHPRSEKPQSHIIMVCSKLNFKLIPYSP